MSFASGAAQLMALNVWSRVLTFALNQLALRYITRNVLGIVGVEMELLLATVLFLSRECIRMALLRCDKTLPNNAGPITMSHEQYALHQRIVNLAYLPIAFGAVIIGGISSYFSYFHVVVSPSGTMRAVFCGAAFVELLAEPFYILSVNNLFFGVRVRIEGLAMFVKCVATVACLRASRIESDTLRVSERDGVAAFAWAQLAYASVLLAGFLLHFARVYKHVRVADSNQVYPQQLWLLIPRRVSNDSEESGKGKLKEYYADPNLSSLAITFAKQGLFKYALTEGDKILSVAFITEAIQGDYSLVEKYGSIIARLLFQPIEEMSRVYFSKTLTTSSTAATSAVSESSSAKEKRAALTLLTLLLRLYTLLSLYFLAFGTNYTSLLIDLLASSAFSSGSAPQVFSAYCLYIPLLAINGVTEAFLQSVAPRDVLMKQSYWMALCWCVFIVTGWSSIQLAGLGGVGIVLANSINMLMRIWFALNFIGEYFRVGKTVAGANSREDEIEIERMLDPKRFIPKTAVLVAFVAAWGVTHTSNATIGWRSLTAKLQHIGVGAICFFVVTGVIYISEKSLISQVRQLVRSRKQKEQ
ncbi:Oligosaccharide translocation protein rft1 [Chytriomyces hyalinus]|nr:Oligosaccharide translocation protein rft1 [Chytriomyces hyalinus]